MGLELGGTPADTAAIFIPSAGCTVGCDSCSTSARLGGQGDSGQPGLLAVEPNHLPGDSNRFQAYSDHHGGDFITGRIQKKVGLRV